MKVDKVIKNGRLVLPQGIVEGGIGIENGVIVTIAKSSNLPKADEVVDAKGNFVIPGCIDSHVHFRDPGRTWQEDWWTGSQSAACGGVTTVLDMPGPNELTVKGLKDKLKEAEKKSIVDYGLYGGGFFGGENIKNEVDKIFDFQTEGVIGYKIYLGYPDRSPDDASLFKFYEAIAKTSLPVAMHAENIVIIQLLEKRIKDDRDASILDHPRARPNWVEAEAISKCIIISEAAGNRIHIAHLSTAEGTELIRLAKTKHKGVSAETCPHYLLLTKKHLDKLGPYGKINPPVRGTDSDINALWQGLIDGTVDCITTDHAPHTKDEKEPFWNNIFDAAPGAIGVQTMLPLMLTQVNEGRIPLQMLVRITSMNPAKIFGLYPRKGVIQIGSDADLNIVDLHKEDVILVENQYSKIEHTPFDGWKVKGAPILTLIRGKKVSREGEVIAKPGYGEWIKPTT